MMAAVKANIIVAAEPVTGGSVIHHVGFPEIRAEGTSARDAAGRLHSKLTRTLDSALSTWRREEITHAIADVDAFLKDAE